MASESRFLWIAPYLNSRPAQSFANRMPKKEARFFASIRPLDEWSSGKITRSDRGPKARASSWLSWSICFCSASRFCSNSLARFSARTDIRKWKKNRLEFEPEYQKNRPSQFDKPNENPRERPGPYASSLQLPILELKNKTFTLFDLTV